jgi:TolB-like protein/class 3 adenylate cyclase/Flp pilus assembly protein TadD
MPLAREQRKLAAIVAADVVGYSRLMGRDESGTLARLRKNRTEHFDPILAKYGGRLVKLTGDGALIEFASAVDALSAAIEFQQAMAEANADQPDDTALVFRVGLHLGDLIVDGDDLYGDGVNIAARLEAEAPAGGILISRNVHDAVAGRVKATFDDLGNLALKNIERPIQALSVKWEPSDWQALATSEVTVSPVVASQSSPVPLAFPDKPSIAVLPFQNMSGDPEQEYFADGVVEDIITGLSRFKSLFVIARNSSFTYKGKAVDIKQVGRELGVRYVLEGSVRKAGNRVRITAQLIDATTHAHLWADKFDGPLEDVFELQDQVTSAVVAAVAPAVDRAEIEQMKRKPPRNQHAYDFYLRAMAALYRLTGEATVDTLRWLDKAIEIDPDYPVAHALKAFCYSWRMIAGWMVDREQELKATEFHARRAAELAKDDAAVLAYAGNALSSVLGDYNDAVALIDRALELNPNQALAWAARAWLRVYLGQFDNAIEDAGRYMRLSPLDPNMQAIRNAVASAHLMAGRYGEAVSWARLAMQAKPGWAPPIRVASAAEALAGNLEAAAKYRHRLQELDPSLRISSLDQLYGPHRLDYTARLKQGLRKAGLPE